MSRYNVIARRDLPDLPSGRSLVKGASYMLDEADFRAAGEGVREVDPARRHQDRSVHAEGLQREERR